MKVNFETALGSYRIQRFPLRAQQPLQAWDAADEYLMEYVEQHIHDLPSLSVSIYNDDFGALACWFADLKPNWISDSYVAKQSCLINFSLIYFL